MSRGGEGEEGGGYQSIECQKLHFTILEHFRIGLCCFCIIFFTFGFGLIVFNTTLFVRWITITIFVLFISDLSSNYEIFNALRAVWSQCQEPQNTI